MTIKTPKVWFPAEIDSLTSAFPASIMHLMPAYKDLPEEFKGRDHPMVKIISTWFYQGLPAGMIVKPKPGIDRQKALIHISTIMGSFEPKHQHKEAGCAFLLAQWFETVEIPEETKL